MAHQTVRLKLFSMKTQVINSYVKTKLTCRDLAKIHNCSPATIAAFLAEQGVTLRRRGKMKIKPRTFHERVKMPTD